MKLFLSDNRATQFCSVLLVGLWIVAIIRTLSPGVAISGIAAFGMIAYLLPAFAPSRRTTKIVGSCLFAAGAWLAVYYNSIAALWLGIERSILFAAFLPTLSLLRVVARGDVRITNYRTLLDNVPNARRPAWIVSGGFILASVLSVGVSVVFAPLLHSGASQAERLAQARPNVCGASLALIWSPFFVALAVVSDFLPGMPLAVLVLSGATIGAVGALLAIKVHAPSQPLGGAGEALAALRAFAPPIFLICGLVVVTRSLTGYSTIEAMLLILPILFGLRALSFSQAECRRAARDIWEGLQRMGDDIVVVSAAMIFGTVLISVDWMVDFAPVALLAEMPKAVVMPGTILLMAVCGFVGIQPLVVGTICLVVLTDLNLGLSDLAIGLVVLVGWSASSMLSISSLLVRVTAGQYRVLPEQLIGGRNLAFFLAFLPVSLCLIWILDTFAMRALIFGF